MGDVVVSGAAIVAITPIIATLALVIKTLYNMLIERLKRAENQVDTLLPIMNAVGISLDSVKDELSKTNSSLKDLKDDMKNGRV